MTLGSGGSLPQTFKTLQLVYSARTTYDNIYITWNGFRVTFNGSSTGYSTRMIEGNGASVGSQVQGVTTYIEYALAVPDAATTANTFGNGCLLLPNYSTSANKVITADRVTENNATQASQLLFAGLWANSAAITSITITDADGLIAANSTFTLYGLK